MKINQSEQLWVITKNLLQNESLTANPEAEAHLRSYLTNLYDTRDKFFGNARTSRQIVGDIVMKQNLRLASMPSDQRKKEHLSELIFDDVKHLQTQAADKRQTLGFKFGS